MIMSSIFFLCSSSICLSIIDFPFISTRGFGKSLVSEPNLEPRPAAIKIALIILFF